VKLELSRRMVFAGALAGLGLASAAAWAGLGRPRAAIRAVIRRNVGQLNVPVDAIDAFADEFWPGLKQRLGRKGGVMLAMLEVGRPLTDVVGSRRIESAEREIVTAFLLGSDFFRAGSSPEHPISWVGLARTCQNPFRRG
jgi:hypothetical protein